MKKLVFAILLLANCQTKYNIGVSAKLTITEYIDKSKGNSLLVLTTIFENRTGENIYMIKGYPLDPEFDFQYPDRGNTDLDQELGIIPHPEFTHRVMDACVNQSNYLEKVIDHWPEKRRIVDSITNLNMENIKLNYGNYKYKFESQFLVLEKGETLEVDNILVYRNFKDKLNYKFRGKQKNEIENRRRLGEDLKIPRRIGKYVFWDGEIKLDSQEIEVVFKEI